MSPAELLEAAKQRVPTINLATVYRSVNRLMERGDIALVSLPGEPPRYELKSAAEHHHHHFRCDNCHKVYDVPGCVHGIEAMVPQGFKTRGHEVVIYGLCPACSGGGRSSPPRN